MDIAHPGWEQAYIAQGDAYCASQGVHSNPARPTIADYIVCVPGGDPTQNPYGLCGVTDAWIQHFLGQRGYNCQTWSALPVAQQRAVVTSSGAVGSSGSLITQLVQAIGAHCLKRAVQATNMPVASQSMQFAPKLTYSSFTRPAGQAVSPSTSPMMAGILGAAIGGAIGYFVGKR